MPVPGRAITNGKVVPSGKPASQSRDLRFLRNAPCRYMANGEKRVLVRTEVAAAGCQQFLSAEFQAGLGLSRLTVALLVEYNIIEPLPLPPRTKPGSIIVLSAE